MADCGSSRVGDTVFKLTRNKQRGHLVCGGLRAAPGYGCGAKSKEYDVRSPAAPELSLCEQAVNDGWKYDIGPMSMMLGHTTLCPGCLESPRALLSESEAGAADNPFMALCAAWDGGSGRGLGSRTTLLAQEIPMTVEKPSNAVFRRLFTGKATPEDKAQIQAYHQSRRAAPISKDERNRRRREYDRMTRAAKRREKLPAKGVRAVQVFPGVWSVQQSWESEEYLVAAYEQTGRALVSYRGAGEEGMYLTPHGNLVDNYRQASHGTPAKAFQAIANRIEKVVVWGLARGGLLRFEPGRPVSTRMNLKEFTQQYQEEIKAALPPGVNFFKAAKIAKVAYEGAPEQFKVAAIGASIAAAHARGELVARSRRR